MLFALFAFVTALQAQTPAPHVQVAAYKPATAPAPATPAPNPASAPAPVVAPEPEAEPVAEPRTREVCRYVEVTGQRFPVRRCRTVPVED